jgi:hypothetical protein
VLARIWGRCSLAVAGVMSALVAVIVAALWSRGRRPPNMPLQPASGAAAPARLLIGLFLLSCLLTACDSVVSTRLRLSPAPPPLAAPRAADSMAPSAHAVDAVKAIALRFGLEPLAEGHDHCVGAWAQPENSLYICVRRPVARGDVEVYVSEVGNRWSARGDSLHRALADTLATLGRVRRRN